jgi:TolB protein
LLLAGACGENHSPPEPVGQIRVTISTTGASVDPDGYVVALDGGAGQPIQVNGTLLIERVATGDHVLTLLGVAGNCHVAEEQPLTVVVSADQTTQASFTINCEEIGRLAFVFSGDIYSISADASGRRQLTYGVDAHWPRWSPDGRKIAYVLSDGIGVMNADGTGQDTVWRLSGEYTRNSPPSWAPDSRRLVFASSKDNVNLEIYTMNSDGTEVQRLTSDNEFDNDPAWAPDGNRIAFVSSRGDSEFGWDIFTMRPDGSGITRLTSGDFSYYHTLAWSPDGTQIVYEDTMTPDGGLVRGLQIFNLDGTPPSYNAAYLVEDGWGPAWSPEGSVIAYSGIGLIRPDGSGSRLLTEGREPSWAPSTVGP